MTRNNHPEQVALSLQLSLSRPAEWIVSKRRRSESNRRIADLQSAALPLGHGAMVVSYWVESLHSNRPT